MSVQHFKKECPGCHKTFNRNRSRKKHILGHKYRNSKGHLFECKPCPMIPDDKRQEYAVIYKLIPAPIKPHQMAA